MLKRQNINNQINLRFTPATNLKVGTFVLTPNFTKKKNFQKIQPLRKGPYQIIDKRTDVTYNFIDSNKKKKLFNIEITSYLIIQKSTLLVN